MQLGLQGMDAAGQLGATLNQASKNVIGHGRMPSFQIRGSLWGQQASYRNTASGVLAT
jgi:hypothetical protein